MLTAEKPPVTSASDSNGSGRRVMIIGRRLHTILQRIALLLPQPGEARRTALSRTVQAWPCRQL